MHNLVRRAKIEHINSRVNSNNMLHFPFQVKTRLQPQISGEEAAKLYTAFLQDLDKRFNSRDNFDCWYAISPDNYNENILKGIINLTNFFMQQGVDLGERMNQAFQTLFTRGYERTVLIGSDIPAIPLDYVHQAFRYLNNYDCVIGPSDDGGYYLIALRMSHPVLFQNQTWSTTEVFNQTITILEENQLSFKILPRQHDIDTIKDLITFYNSLKGATKESSDFPSQSWSVMSRLIRNLEIE